MKPVRDMTVVLHVPEVKAVCMNGKSVCFAHTDKGIEVVLPAALHEKEDVKITVIL